MQEKKKGRATADTVIALYATAVFLALFLVPTLIDPHVHTAAQGAGRPSPLTGLAEGAFPGYPLGGWIGLFAPLGGVLCFAVGRFAARRGPKADIVAAITTFSALFTFALIFAINFRFSISYMATAVLLVGVVALIQSLRYHYFDFTFTRESDVPIACRIERLKCTYDEWARTLMWFLGLTTLIMITAIIALSQHSSDRFGAPAAELIARGMIVYALTAVPGVAFGIVWPSFRKLTELAHSFTKIRE